MLDDAAAERLPRPALAGIAGAWLLLYVFLAPRVMGEGDSAEFTLALALAGVPHPPGYPLFTWTGSAFAHLLHAFGVGWAHAANLWSALGAGCAVLFTAALADRLIPASVRLGHAARGCVVAAATAALAASPTFLRAATQAEVYSWEVAWTALAALTALSLLRQMETPLAIQPRAVALAAFAWGAIAGAVLAHRPTMAATAVPLTLLLGLALWRQARPGAAPVFAALAGLCLPLASHLFTAWRAWHPAAFQWPLLEPSAASVLTHIMGSYYGSYLGGRAAGGSGGTMFLSTLLPFFALAAIATAFVLPRLRESPRRNVLLALIVSAALQGAFVALYGVNDFDFFLLPLLVPSVALIAGGLALLVSRAREPLSPAALLLTAVTAIGALSVSGEHTRLRSIVQVDASVREAFEALPFERGIVVWNSDSYTRLVGLQLLESRKRDLVVLNGGVLTWERARRDATRRLGFDPLEGLELRTDADLEQIAPHLAGRTELPVADFALWWNARAARR